MTPHDVCERVRERMIERGKVTKWGRFSEIDRYRRRRKEGTIREKYMKMYFILS